MPHALPTMDTIRPDLSAESSDSKAGKRAETSCDEGGKAQAT